MKEIPIEIPNGIQFISEYRSYEIPLGHCIVDKGVTGCGYTEYCLTNSRNIVLCSPRKLLLENKRDQHLGDLNILYLENDVEGYTEVLDLKAKVKDHIFNCLGPFQNLPCKFMVTYDSCHYVIEALKELRILGDFTFIVDEFQSIFLDSYFKAEVEFDFVDYLQDCPNVVYLSATPLMKRHLDKIPEFMNLPFYYLDWSNSGVVENIVIQRKFSKSLVGECSKIIQDYKSGKYPFTYQGSQVIQSKEAVFYFNSVGDIIKVINKNKLSKDEVNIICSRTDENRSKLRRIGHQIGKIPLKGESNKMFTFCTRTAYIGADFYSDNAKSYVFADPNVSALALDISLDLPQIVGRQRDKSNPFKNDITIFYRTIRQKEIVDRELFDKLQRERQESTNNLLNVFKKCTDREKQDYIKKLRDGIQVSQYSGDFVSISRKTGEPIYNKFIEISNERAWEVSQKDYQDKISVTKALLDISSDIDDYKDSIEEKVTDFLDNHFYKTGIFREKMRMYCEFMDSHKEFSQELSDLIYFKIKDERFRKFYSYYGTVGCRAASYEEKPLSLGMSDVTKESELRMAIYHRFKEGDRYLMKNIKLILGDIYRNLRISKTPKATDLGEFFKLTKTLIKNSETGKKENGFRLDPLY